MVAVAMAAVAVVGAETAGVVEEELTPLEVLTELCWMASFWGLLGMDISSQLSSLSETEDKGQKMTVYHDDVVVLLHRCFARFLINTIYLIRSRKAREIVVM